MVFQPVAGRWRPGGHGSMEAWGGGSWVGARVGARAEVEE